MSTEYERLKEALNKAPTPEARAEAAQRFKEYQEKQKALGKRNSEPTLVSLSTGKKYPTAVPLDKVADEIATNPEYFELVRKITTGEKK